MSNEQTVLALAARLRDAEYARQPVAPVRDEIPSGDAAFAAFAQAIVAELPRNLRPEATMAELRRRLQTRYPGAVVRPREQLADVGTGHEIVWYATNRAHRSRIVATLDVPAPRNLVFRTYTERVVEWQTAVKLQPRRIEWNSK